jgi:hypothetical protein
MYASKFLWFFVMELSIYPNKNDKKIMLNLFGAFVFSRYILFLDDCFERAR